MSRRLSKDINSLTCNHLETNKYEFLKKKILSMDVQFVQIVINELWHNIDTYNFLNRY